MNTYNIAGLTVSLQASGKTLARQSPPYLSSEPRPVDFAIAVDEDFMRLKQKENPHLSPDECEYIWTGFEFYRQLLDFQGMMLHASALVLGNRSYLFSAPCGTGKSTHARLWQQHFGIDKARIINDDKPAIRFIDNSFYVYGTPWSGQSEYNLNLKVPLQAICFLQQSTSNWIRELESKTVLPLILNQTLRPRDQKPMEKLLALLDKLIRQVPFYQMGCTISTEAVAMAHQVMSSGQISASVREGW